MTSNAIAQMQHEKSKCNCVNSKVISIIFGDRSNSVCLNSLWVSWRNSMFCVSSRHGAFWNVFQTKDSLECGRLLLDFVIITSASVPCFHSLRGATVFHCKVLQRGTVRYDDSQHTLWRFALLRTTSISSACGTCTCEIT